MVGIFNYPIDPRVKSYSEYLAKNGSKVDVLGIQQTPQDVVMHNYGIRVFTIAVSGKRTSPFAYALQYFFAFIVLFFRLTEMHFKNKYDVVHFHNMPDFLVFAGLILKLIGVKVILDIHDLLPEVYISKFSKNQESMVVRLIKLEEKISTKFANEVIVANKHFRSKLIERGTPSSKITVVKNFPDPNIFNRSRYGSQKREDDKAFTLIFPGTIAPRYGLEVAIKALPMIKEGVPDVKLIVIGRQVENVKTLEALARQLGVANNVEFKPAMPLEEIPNQLLQADIGIYPALPDPHMSIAIPGKLLEFAAMSLPIISSRLSIVEEMFDESAVMFFEPGNSYDFALCVLKLYENRGLRESIARNANYIFVQEHSGDHEFRSYLEVLHRLIPTHKLE